MSMRMLPALCAGAMMLAACSRADSEPPAARALPEPTTGYVTPGEGHIDNNVGNTVYFEIDSATLTSDAQLHLQKQAAWIQVYPQHSITIEGHADERGTREYNLALGERRAQAVMDYFIALGVEPKRLKTISYGKERPICTEADEPCWSQNRRSVSTIDQ